MSPPFPLFTTSSNLTGDDSQHGLGATQKKN